jgi:hypothetical protein
VCAQRCSDAGGLNSLSATSHMRLIRACSHRTDEAPPDEEAEAAPGPRAPPPRKSMRASWLWFMRQVCVLLSNNRPLAHSVLLSSC